jgi:hypothetical protein
MPNMSHCRFHNTLGDLRDCYAALTDDSTADPFAGLSEPEAKAARALIKLCQRIVDDFAED